jgi:hypothetical protein
MSELDPRRYVLKAPSGDGLHGTPTPISIVTADGSDLLGQLGGGGQSGPDFDIRQYGTVDMTGATDCSTAFLAALTAAQAAGGTLVLPPGTLRINSQITLAHENDTNVTTGIQNQKSVRITGAGQSKDMNGSPDSGTILDLRYSGSGAKIQSFGTGIFEMDHMTLTDFGTSSTPFVLVTITIPKFHNLTVVGNPSKTHAQCDQDAFVFGGNTNIYTTTATGPFGGYGGSVTSCSFDRIRRAVWCRVYCTINIFDNHINQAAGAADGTAAAIDIDVDTAGVGFCNDNRVFNNYIETQGYVYGIAIRGGRNNTVVNNGFWDPTPGHTLASVYCSETALNNLVVNLSEGETTIDFIDAHPGNNMFVGRDNTHGGMKILGGVNFADTGKATLYEGALVVEGNGVDANAPLQVKPNQTTIPGDGAELIRVARHIGAGWHPGETAFSVRHDGTAVIPLPGTGVNMQDGYIHDGKLWKRWSAGNIDLDPSGGAVVCVNQTPFYAGTGTTAQRPTGVFDGAQYNDTTIGKPIWRFGGAWKDAAGNVV